MILFATSFHEKMYNATGKDLLRSWLNHWSNGKMTVYAEGTDLDYVQEASDDRVNVVGIDDDPWLNAWLEENRDNIPVELGGACTGEMSMWDRKSSLWARKTAAFQRAYADAEHGDLVVWLDADVIITDDVPEDLLASVSRKRDIVYACSASRKRKTGIESGVVILRKRPEVDAVMDRIREKYDRMAKRWKELPRHDDGYVLLVVLREMTQGDFFANSHRLSSGARCFDMSSQNNSNPLTCCPLAPYMVHQKGLHASLGTDGMNSAPDGNDKKKNRTKAYNETRRKARENNS
nr:hypothetical protein TetV2_00433 [Oceanusvirus sp.]